MESLAEAVWQEEEAQKQLQLSQLQLESDQLNHLLNLLNQDENTLDLLGRRILSLQGRDSHPFQQHHHSLRRRISEDFHSIHGWSNPLASGSNVLVEDQNQDQQARSVVEALKEELLQDDDQDQDELDEIIFHHLPSISFISSDSEELKSRDRALESSIDLELDWLAEELLRARDEDGDGIWIMGTDALFGDGDTDGFGTINLEDPGIEALKCEYFSRDGGGGNGAYQSLLERETRRTMLRLLKDA